jgi:hypothetical protein
MLQPMLKAKISPKTKIAIKEKLSENVRKLEMLKQKLESDKKLKLEEHKKIIQDISYLFYSRLY